MSDGNVPVDTCSSSKLSDKCQPAPLSAEDSMHEEKIDGLQLKLKRKIRLTTEPPPAQANTCDAKFSVSYAQMNEEIAVDADISNISCGASHGVFTVHIRTKNAASELLDRTFEQPWSRTNDKPILTTYYYPMADGIDLVWVRISSDRKTACICD
ncbi:MAG: hypothetical protein AAF512_09815 [Pseudomonadota bacterium]